MILFIPIITAVICMFSSYFVFFVNIAKLQARLREVGANLPPEYLYLNTMLISAARVGSKSLVSEIKVGSLSSLKDERVNFLCHNIIVSEKAFKISAITFISLLLVGFSLIAWVTVK
ncbi:hypothetical protein GCM10025791_23160 [Halioxenophilus aromaticivorans]|uniref:Uncharacterized protein n=1 Tax=Halioxenophilus aromaticivorans TaxID=1306992 RepID=A0AAV3U380_9ALTE